MVADVLQSYVGVVANPSDILAFTRKRVAARKGQGDAGLGILHRFSVRYAVQDEVVVGGDVLLAGDVDEAPPIQSLVADFVQEHPLKVLGLARLAEAVQEYVEKGETKAIAQYVFSFLWCVCVLN